MSGAEPSRSPGAERLDRVAVALFVLLWTALLLRLLPSLPHLQPIWPILAGVLVGYLVADLLSGAVHWLADRYFAPESWLIGPLLIAPFREHHADASRIARHDFFEVSGNNALVSLPLMLGLLALPLPTADGASSMLVFGHGLGLGLTAALFLTNQIHGWAHQKAPARPIRRLQSLGLILSPERHAPHHRHHDRAYCVTSGWLNPLLDRMRFFARLERLVDALRRGRGPAA